MTEPLLCTETCAVPGTALTQEPWVLLEVTCELLMERQAYQGYCGKRYCKWLPVLQSSQYFSAVREDT
ncbi:hypothetical protein VTO42DRAFT_2249 [Malbranchea cinnamomea]